MEATIDERLERIERLLMLNTKEVLNTEELCTMLGYTADYVRHLVHDRKIPHYKKGSRVYFKKSEIEAWQLERRVPTTDETERMADDYVASRACGHLRYK